MATRTKKVTASDEPSLITHRAIVQEPIVIPGVPNASDEVETEKASAVIKVDAAPKPKIVKPTIKIPKNEVKTKSNVAADKLDEAMVEAVLNVAVVTPTNHNHSVIQPLANSVADIKAALAQSDTKPVETTPIETKPTETVPPEKRDEGSHPVDQPKVTDAPTPETKPNEITKETAVESLPPQTTTTDQPPETNVETPQPIHDVTPVTTNAGRDSDAQITSKDAPMTELEVTQAEEAQVKRKAELEKIIESKQYYLPIVTSDSRRATQFITVGVLASVVLAAVWVDVALDSGLIHLGGLKAVTHFFGN